MMARSARVVINQKKSILSRRLISSEGELLVPGKIQPILKMICKTSKIQYIDVSCGKTKIKKKDIIRFSNMDKKLESNKEHIFEFIITNLIKTMVTTNDETKLYVSFYTIKKLITYSIELCNQIFIEKINTLLEHYEEQIDIKTALYSGYDMIEKNNYLLRYADEVLYEHQKQLFTLCKHACPKLISYISPTGTGKTLSPLGLSENYRVIFVCAARHV